MPKHPDPADQVHETVLIALTTAYQRNSAATAADYAAHVIEELTHEYPALTREADPR